MYNILQGPMLEKTNSYIDYYNKYKDKIYTYLWYRSGYNSQIAEDLTSDVFLKALKSFDSFDPEKSFQAWIYAIAKNHLINYYTKSGREVPLDEAEKAHYCMEENFDNKDELEKIIIKINELKNYHKEVLLLRFVDGLSNVEIAEMINKDEGAVRTQISRALKELREII